MNQFKKCCFCNTEKSLTEFSKRTASKDGLQSFCNNCNRIQTRKYYNKHREERIKYSKNYRLENIDKITKRDYTQEEFINKCQKIIDFQALHNQKRILL